MMQMCGLFRMQGTFQVKCLKQMLRMEEEACGHLHTLKVLIQIVKGACTYLSYANVVQQASSFSHDANVWNVLSACILQLLK
jgi:hypothetical protein